jgi:hypothetical protein
MSGSVPNVEDHDIYAVPEYGPHLTVMRNMMLTIQQDKQQYAEVRDYVKGNHRKPNVPATARIEVREIAKRSTMNLMPLLIGVPSQLCFIEGFRVGAERDPKEWEVFKRSNMASKQTTAFEAALSYGNSFLALEPDGEELEIKLLQTPNTVAYYHDPVNDMFPAYVMTIRSQPHLEKPGLVVVYDEEAVTYYDWVPSSSGEDDEFILNDRWEHDMPYTPVARLVTQMDDEGVVTGLVGQLTPLQDRVNQSAFDLLVTQTFSSFKVRWASGMLGNPVMDEDEDGNIVPRVDADGNQVYEPIPIDQSTWIMTDDPAARVGTLDETPLDGFLEALDHAIRHFAVIGQLPPHNLMGSMSNVNAETLQSAMSQTIRFTHVLKVSWGTTISNLLGLASIQMGVRDSLDDYDAEVRWRDMSDNTLGAVVDALGKGAQMLDIPKRSLWRRFPGVTHSELLEWEETYEEEFAERMMQDVDTPDGAAAREREYFPETDATQMPAEPLPAFDGGTGVAGA